MRIRRRPPAQALLPSLQQHPDPSTAPQPPPPNAPRNRQHWLLTEPEGEEEGKKGLEEFQLHPTVDLGGAGDDEPPVPRRAPLPLLPQAGNGNGNGNGNVVGRRSESQGGGAAAVQPRRQGAAADGHGHRSGLENGHREYRAEPAANAGECFVNGVIAGTPAAAVTSLNMKEERKNDSNGSGGTKKRRGPPVLMKGSRCSRVNGRGWRCSQPTLVGYSLCEHHLGKGRMRSGAGRVGGGGAQLGRTEPGRKNAAAVAVVTAAVPRADKPPSVRHC